MMGASGLTVPAVYTLKEAKVNANPHRSEFILAVWSHSIHSTKASISTINNCQSGERWLYTNQTPSLLTCLPTLSLWQIVCDFSMTKITFAINTQWKLYNVHLCNSMTANTSDVSKILSLKKKKCAATFPVWHLCIAFYQGDYVFRLFVPLLFRFYIRFWLRNLADQFSIDNFNGVSIAYDNACF